MKNDDIQGAVFTDKYKQRGDEYNNMDYSDVTNTL